MRLKVYINGIRAIFEISIIRYIYILIMYKIFIWLFNMQYEPIIPVIVLIVYTLKEVFDISKNIYENKKEELLK